MFATIGDTRMAGTSPWGLDPGTLALTGPDRYHPFTAREFDAQLWPPCPVCGTMIKVDGIRTQSATETKPTFIIGGWRCPRGCDPRSQLG